MALHFFRLSPTIVWLRSDRGEPVIREPQIRPHTAWTGPLFFERDGNVAILRYSKHGLPEHALSFLNLRAELRRTAEPIKAYVAGISPDGSLYIETLPGRIFETAWALCRSDEIHPAALDRLDWRMFGVGDWVQLRSALDASDQYSQEGVLLNWRHGLRNAIGPNGALMARYHIDKQKGAAVYGAKAFSVTLPASRPETLPLLAIVGGDAPVQDAPQLSELELRTTLILVATPDRGLAIDGLPGWVAEPAAHFGDGGTIAWRSDSFFASLIAPQRGQDALVVDHEGVCERIAIAGGALPVTFEAIQRDSEVTPGRILFSRRDQNARLADHEIARSRVVGLLSKSGNVALAIGGRHFEIPATHLIEGLPDDLLEPAIAALELREYLWVCGAHGKFHVGVEPRADVEKEHDVRMFVRAVAAICDTNVEKLSEESTLIRGIICVGCRDSRLYWLGVENLGTARITKQQAMTAFAPDLAEFEVVRLATGGLSIIRLPRIKHEIDKLRPGIATMVKPFLAAPASSSLILPQFIKHSQGRCYLARSTETGLLMSLVLDDLRKCDATTGAIAVEIESRWREGEAIWLSAVERGGSHSRADIPDELFAPLIEHHTLAPGKIEGSDVPKQTKQQLIDRMNDLVAARIYGLREGLGALLQLGNDDWLGDPDILRAIARLITDLGRRALRSFHLEPLERRHASLLQFGEWPYESPEFAKRLNGILDIARDNSARADAVGEGLDALMLFVSLQPEHQIAGYLARALSAGLGGRHDLAGLVCPPCDTIVGALLTTLRRFGYQCDATGKSEVHSITMMKDEFQKIAQELERANFDMRLPRGFVQEKLSPPMSAG